MLAVHQDDSAHDAAPPPPSAPPSPDDDAAPDGVVPPTPSPHRPSPGGPLSPHNGSRTHHNQNRFGFRKRPLPAPTSINVGLASSNAPPEAPLLDLVGLLDEHLPVESLQAIVRTRVTANAYDFKARINELTDIVKQAKDALREQIRAHAALMAAFAQVQEDTNGRLTSLSAALAAARTSSERQRVELSAARRRSDERLRASQALRDRLSEVETECARLSLAESEATSRAAASAREVATLSDSLSSTQAELSSAQQEVSTLSARAVSLDEQLEASTARISELSSEVAAATDTNTSLTTELAAATDANTSLAAELASLQVDTASKMGSLEARLADTTSSLVTAHESNATLTSELSSAQSANTALTAQLERSDARITMLDGQLSELHTRERALHEAATNAAAEHARIDAARLASESRCSELSLEVSTLSAEHSAATALAASLTSDVSTARESNAALTAKLEHADSANAALTAEARNKSQLVEELLDSKHKLEVEFSSYREHHGSSNAQQMEAIAELKVTVDRLSSQVETKENAIESASSDLASQAETIEHLAAKLNAAESTRRKLHNQVQELKGNIRVFCRMRPGDISADAEAAVSCNEENTAIVLCRGPETYNFSYDKVFPPSASQEAVFSEVDGLVQSSLDGYKVCLFAYGQTGSGKTYTMQGPSGGAAAHDADASTPPPTWGLIPRSLAKILSCASSMRAAGWAWEMQASFVEVYNETLRDLLHDAKTGAPAPLAIKHEETWGTSVQNAQRVEVSSMEQIKALMTRANGARAVGKTDMNAQSSRSHSVFSLYLHGLNETLGTELHGALHLVDLAGSERLSRSGATGDRLRETQNINKSLSSLTDVFAAKAAKQAHVPFRNSKLTHLMEPCLSGQGKTLMLVNVGPEMANAHETLCSLRFASQVSQCDTGGKPKRAAKPVGASARPPTAMVRPQTAGARPQSARAGPRK